MKRINQFSQILLVTIFLSSCKTSLFKKPSLIEDSKEDQQMKAEKALKALNRISDLVKERRSLLVEKSKS